MQCWGSSDPHSVYRPRLAARWAAPSVPQVPLLLSPHVLGRQQACCPNVAKQHNSRKISGKSGISRTLQNQACEYGYLLNLVNLSCH